MSGAESHPRKRISPRKIGLAALATGVAAVGTYALATGDPHQRGSHRMHSNIAKELMKFYPPAYDSLKGREMEQLNNLPTTLVAKDQDGKALYKIHGRGMLIDLGDMDTPNPTMPRLRPQKGTFGYITETDKGAELIVFDALLNGKPEPQVDGGIIPSFELCTRDGKFCGKFSTTGQGQEASYQDPGADLTSQLIAAKVDLPNSEAVHFKGTVPTVLLGDWLDDHHISL